MKQKKKEIKRNLKKIVCKYFFKSVLFCFCFFVFLRKAQINTSFISIHNLTIHIGPIRYITLCDLYFKRIFSYDVK